MLLTKLTSQFNAHLPAPEMSEEQALALLSQLNFKSPAHKVTQLIKLATQANSVDSKKLFSLLV